MKMRLILSGLLCAFATAAANGAEIVRVLHAGSLITVFQREIGPAFERQGYELQAEGRGSVANANLIRGGLKQPDLFISADADVTKRMLAEQTPVTWYATFATTRLVLAYSPSSKFAEDFRRAAKGETAWYDVLKAPGIRLGRTDPAIDPKGYRTVIAMELAERHYKRSLRQDILGENQNPAQILNDETILLRLEQGELDAAFLYSIEARIRHLPTVPLPRSIDLGEPQLASTYRLASMSVNGVTHVGEPIAYALSIPANARNPRGAIALVHFLVEGGGRTALEASGFEVRPLKFYGDPNAVPPELRSSARKRGRS